jgi:hypothetical protein
MNITVCSTGGMILADRGRLKYREQHTSSTTNVTWIGLEANLDLCSVRLARNRLRCGPASCLSDTLILLCYDGRYGCCGEGGSCSYLLRFPGCTIHSTSGATVRRWKQIMSFTTEARVQFQVSPRGLCGGRNDTGTDGSVSWCSRFPRQYHCASTPY